MFNTIDLNVKVTNQSLSKIDVIKFNPCTHTHTCDPITLLHPPSISYCKSKKKARDANLSIQLVKYI